MGERNSLQGQAEVRFEAFPPSAVLLIAALAAVTFAEGVLLSVVPATVAAIGRLFDASAGTLNWVSTVQLLAIGVCTPAFSRLGDTAGHRRMLRLAVVLAAAGGVLTALAPDFGLLLAGRALQGPIGAFTPLAAGILRDRLGTHRLRRGIGVAVAALTAGSAVGLVVAAEVYRASHSVRVVLWIPAACLIAAAAVTFGPVPETRPRAPGRMDWLGALFLGAGLGMLLLVLADGTAWGWASGPTAGWAAGGVSALVLWGVIELRVADPLVDLRAVSRRVVAPFYLASLTIGVAFFGATTATVTFMASPAKAAGYGFGLDVTAIAYVTLPSSCAVILGALAVAPVARRAGHRAIVCLGCACLLAGYGGLAAWHGAIWQLIVFASLAGLGVGVVSGAMPVVLTERAARTSAAISTGLFITGRAVGGSIAGAGFAALLTRITIGHTGIPRQSGYVAVWLICAAASLVSLVIVATATRGGQVPESGPGAARAQRRSRRRLLAGFRGGVMGQHKPRQFDAGGDGELGEGVP
jgi:MFS family permease